MENDYSMLQYTIPRKWVLVLGSLVMEDVLDQYVKDWLKEELDAFVETINCGAYYVGESETYPCPMLSQMRGE